MNRADFFRRLALTLGALFGIRKAPARYLEPAPMNHELWSLSDFREDRDTVTYNWSRGTVVGYMKIPHGDTIRRIPYYVD